MIRCNVGLGVYRVTVHTVPPRDVFVCTLHEQSQAAEAVALTAGICFGTDRKALSGNSGGGAAPGGQAGMKSGHI